MRKITIAALAIAVMGAYAGMRISQEPRVSRLPATGMLVTDDSTVGTKSVPVGAIAALVSDSGFARVSGHVDSARAAYKADTAKKAKYADSANLATLATVAKRAWNADSLNGYAAGNYVKYSDSTQQYSTTASAFTTYYGAGGSSYGWKVTARAFGSWTLDYGAVGGSPTRKFEVGATGGITADTFNGRFKGTSDSAKTAAFAYAATYGDTSRAAKVADSAKKLPVIGAAGTYRSVTTDAYGRVVSGATPTTLGPGYGVSYSDTVLANHYLRKDTAQTMSGLLSLPSGSISAGANITSTSFTVTNTTPNFVGAYYSGTTNVVLSASNMSDGKSVSFVTSGSQSLTFTAASGGINSIVYVSGTWTTVAAGTASSAYGGGKMITVTKSADHYHIVVQ